MSRDTAPRAGDGSAAAPASVRTDPDVVLLQLPPHRRSRWLFVIPAIVIVAAVAFFVWRREEKSVDAKTAAAQQAARAVPVVAVAARTGDQPVYLDGLGTVTALNTVTVHSRVDGELVKVAFTEGQLVKAGDLLFEIDPRPFQVLLEQAQGLLDKDKALLNNARLDLQRYKDALEAIPEQLVDTAAANVALNEGAVRVDQSQIDNAKLQLSYSHITSPLAGKVGLRLVDQGNIVHASDAGGLAVITQLEPIAVVFSLPQANLPRVLESMKAGNPTAEAWDQTLTTKLASGALQAVDNQVDTQNGTVRLKAQFDNEDGALFPNQFVNVRLLVETQKNVVLVPTAAVQRSPDAMFVYVVKDDQTVKAQPVTLGPTEHSTVVVTKGVSDGDKVVTDGVDKLKDGSKIVLREPGVDAGHPAAAHAPPAADRKKAGKSGEPGS